MSIQNPVEKDCFKPCKACLRCADNGRYARCSTCSGRNDPLRRRLHDPDDVCSCSEGILRYVTQDGRRIVAKFPGSPYGGSVRADTPTPDEEEYRRYLYEQRSHMDDDTWDPVRFSSGESTDAWLRRYKSGMDY